MISFRCVWGPLGAWSALSFAICCSPLVSLSVWAKPLQIIHTNDLHSYLETAEHAGWGGYAAVKAVIERLKRDAASRGIDSVTLDAGDFSEGSQFFFADKGKQTWRIIDSMGFDAVTIGNHDWLIGAQQMEEIFSTLRPRTPFLAANMRIDRKFPWLHRGIKSAIELERDGLKIAILGVTTDELVYRWRMNAGGIGAPLTSVEQLAPTLKNRNDLVIALTHLGVMEDIKLVGRTRDIDLVVGGHSHTRLSTPLSIKNKSGALVPIVQTGEHGQWVGSLILDVEPGKAAKVLSYELVPVRTEEGTSPEAAVIASMTETARKQLESRYTPEWLYDTVGFSELPMERPVTRYTQWGNFALEAIREAAGADLAIDPGEFHGSSQDAGVITNETIIKSYPRVFEVNNPMGWTVWKIRAPGWLLKFLFEYVTNNGLHMNVAGLTFDSDSSSGKVKISNIRVQGKPIKSFKNYTIGVTEGIGRGAIEITFLLQLAFSPKNTGFPVWGVLERKLRETGGSFGDQSYLTPVTSGNIP
jgi:2',3'-cyclic-nucleotide 2'-phosphodiesterase (5'-nucleotidase family)